WSHTLAVTERNPFAHYALAAALISDPNLALTSNNQGNLNTEQKRLDEAHWHCEEALKSYRQLAQKKPAGYLPEMATTLSILGAMDRLDNRLDDARQHDEKALKSYRQLAQKKP